MALKKSQKSLKDWTKQKWRTKSGKPSAKTGERYLPDKAIKSLSSSEYAATTRAKRKGTKAGKQFVAQPKGIAKKTKQFRASKGGLAQQAAVAISMKKRGVKPKGKKK
tara:strand:- start:475 stop:798 length:324 start_codon:yes stop_codon:yes gene_type:complete